MGHASLPPSSPIKHSPLCLHICLGLGLFNQAFYRSLYISLCLGCKRQSWVCLQPTESPSFYRKNGSFLPKGCTPSALFLTINLIDKPDHTLSPKAVTNRTWPVQPLNWSVSRPSKVSTQPVWPARLSWPPAHPARPASNPASVSCLASVELV